MHDLAGSRPSWQEPTPVSELPSVDDLALALAERAQRGAATGAALLALAAMAPRLAAQWLLEHAADGTTVSRAQLASVLATIAESFVNAPDLLTREESLRLLARYGHLLPHESASEFVAAIRSDRADKELAAAIRASLERARTPALIRAAAELAIAAEEHDSARDLLAQLGEADGSLAAMQFVHTARRRLPKTAHPETRIALLSSFTIDPLVPYVDHECRSLKLEPTFFVAPFNTWDREMLGGGSALERFDPQIAFVSVAADDVLPELASAPSASDLASAGAAAVDRILNAASRFLSWSRGVLVVHSLYSAFRDPLGPASSRDGRSRSEIIAELNARLAEGLRALPRAYLLDLTDVLARRRGGAIDHPKMRHLASMRLGDQVLGDVGRSYARFVAPCMGRTRKCVVLDLDNTLWGGIVGEDGPNGIRLGHTSPGSEFREFQQYLLSLTRRGILLAVNSKNNEADALEVFRSHESMILRESAFSAMRINWESKANNLLSIAEELNLGLDAFVFVDDSEKERALMRQALPQVLTPEMPRDPALYRELLEGLPELHVLTVTDEDRTRTQQYAERRQREHLRITASTLDDYLRSLDIAAEVDLASDRTLPRVHQLFQRTNQFNLTNRRYELGTLTQRATDGEWRVYFSKVSDRFGDHGLVATAVVQFVDDACVIENLVMSCRVIGYGVEDALLARVEADARRAGARWLVGEFRPSPKNAPARDFFARHKFAADGDASDGQRWRRELAGEPMAVPSWITVRATHGA